MKHEKILPKGTLTPAPSAALRAGGHCKTKMYMAPSKSAWTAPTSMIFLSLSIAFVASATTEPPSLLFDDSAISAGGSLAASVSAAAPALTPPKFSRQRKRTKTAPAAKNSVDSSNGAVGPRFDATSPASWPARMATIASQDC